MYLYVLKEQQKSWLVLIRRDSCRNWLKDGVNINELSKYDDKFKNKKILES